MKPIILFADMIAWVNLVPAWLFDSFPSSLVENSNLGAPIFRFDMSTVNIYPFTDI